MLVISTDCSLIVTFLILSFLDILEDLLRASIQQIQKVKMEVRYKHPPGES